jgi:iron(III) transport system substrate-binding protein
MSFDRQAVLLSLAFATLSIFSLSSQAALAEDSWDEIVAKSKKEGLVVVHGAPGKGYETFSVNAFNKAYPDIKVQFSGAAGAIETPKVLRERQAGIFGWDVWMSGPTGALSQLKPEAFFAPLRPILRPDIMADDKWTSGFEFGWMDTDKNLFYAFDGTLQNPIMVNWDFVKKETITSLADLTKPEFAGKIVWHDPRVNGTGNGTSQTLFRNLGEAGINALFKNKVVYTTNSHQISEWLVRGRYPITIGIEYTDLEDFRKQGLGKNIGPLPESYWKAQQISVGFGGIGLVDRAPHPNAARVYINWILSKEGQEAFSRVPRNSRRTDVTPAFPELVPLPGKEYFIGQSEEFRDERVNMLSLAKKAIDGI